MDAIFPNEIEKKLGELEKELLSKKKELTKLRRSLPHEEIEDYILYGSQGERVRLSELFGGRNELLLIHNMGKGCTYCTMWADGFNGILPHLENKAAFALVSPDDPETQRKFAESRDWKFRMLSCKGTSFAKDLGFQGEDGGYWPGVSTFQKNADGRIFRVSRDFFGPGDNYCSVWHLFDLLPNGPGDWQPKYAY
ncbi:MAG: hypothetical protein CO189_03605 [candidate division Zixibacteria bacterium CG_4_9_14_3_um_filter_46_8]|nr:MAG: hypothetical protein CO189_03605 [candidate division Zixibacteria bacterium CG_4_9_14_3_um_filter_46_8]